MYITSVGQCDLIHGILLKDAMQGCMAVLHGRIPDKKIHFYPWLVQDRDFFPFKKHLNNTGLFYFLELSGRHHRFLRSSRTLIKKGGT
jgi:hypothetical protein